LGTGGLLQGQLDRPFPQYAGLNLNGFGCCSSNYNALQATVTRRFQGGGTMLVSYTSAKLMSNTDTLTSWLEGVSGVKRSYSSTTIIFPHSSLGFFSAGRLGAKPCAARRAARLGRSGEPVCTDGLGGAHVLNRGPEPCRLCLFFVSS